MLVAFSYTTAQFYLRETTTERESRPPPSYMSKDSKLYQSCLLDSSAKLPALKKVHTWRSSKEVSEQSISLVTQLSLERMTMLRSQCNVWGDKISAVIYVPYLKDFGVISDDVKALNGSSLQDIAVFVDDFYQSLEKEAECSLDLQLVLEKFERWDDPNIGLYPFNAIRNRALMMVETEAVILLDADFLPSRQLSAMYKDNEDAYGELMQVLDTKTAFVLPAFETTNAGVDGTIVAKKCAMNGKDHVVTSWENGEVAGFQVAQYAAGHGPTKYEKWLASSDDYPINYAKGFEPYILIARKYVPWYDERFRGYSRNKIVHLTHLADQLGIHLRVHHDGFVVHSPHKKAATFSRTKETGQWDNLLDLYIKVRRDISLGEFVPVTSFAKSCPKTVQAENLKNVIKKKLKIKRRQRKERQASRKMATKTP